MDKNIFGIIYHFEHMYVDDYDLNENYNKTVVSKYGFSIHPIVLYF